MKPFSKEAYNYAVWGALFGLIFPVVATWIEASQNAGNSGLNAFFTSQKNAPLLWIIDTAPLFLGIFAYFIGWEVDKVRQKNQEILHTQQQLILQEQMATIGQMTAGIAHEIKNPLNFVTNFSESSSEIADELVESFNQFKDRFGADDFNSMLEMIEDLKQNAIDIQSNGHRANSIVLALMDQTRGNNGARTNTDINALLETNINLAFQGYKANHPAFNLTLQCNFDQSIPRLHVNPQILGRVFLNILNNACYAVDQKKEARGSTFSPELKVSTGMSDQGVEIRFRDNGPGIPRAIHQSIFEPFFTTKPSGQANTGLGLSICKDIIYQEHGGILTLESRENEFTEFIIRLPMN